MRRTGIVFIISLLSFAMCLPGFAAADEALPESDSQNYVVDEYFSNAEEIDPSGQQGYPAADHPDQSESSINPAEQVLQPGEQGVTEENLQEQPDPSANQPGQDDLSADQANPTGQSDQASQTAVQTEQPGGQTDQPGGQTDQPGGQTDPFTEQAGQTTDPSGQTNQPAGQADQTADPSGQITDPAGQTTDPSGQITGQTDQAPEPVNQPAESINQPAGQTDPSDQPADQINQPEEQVNQPAEPINQPAEQADQANQPAQPSDQPAQPSDQPELPADQQDQDPSAINGEAPSAEQGDSAIEQEDSWFSEEDAGLTESDPEADHAQDGNLQDGISQQGGEGEQSPDDKETEEDKEAAEDVDGRNGQDSPQNGDKTGSDEDAVEEEFEDEEEESLDPKNEVMKGFYLEDGQWKWYLHGEFQSSMTGIVLGTIDETKAWYYIEKGIFKQATGLTQKASGGEDWYYVRDGVFNKATGITKKVSGGRSWYFVKNGVFTKATGITQKADKSSTVWFFVQDGLYTTATGIAQKATGRDSGWYYVKNGKYTKATGLARKADGSDRTWYYVKKGMFAQYTGLAQKADGSSSKWYYVKDGIHTALKAEKPVLTVQNYGDDCNRMEISWTEVPEADGYYLYRSKSPDSGFKLINITETALRYVDSGLTPRTRYYYKVKAYVGTPLKKNHVKMFISTSDTKSGKTKPPVNVYYYTDSDIYPSESNTMVMTTTVKKFAAKILKRMEDRQNFYIFIETPVGSDAWAIVNRLSSEVRRQCDMAIGFEVLRTVDGGNGYYFLVDAETFGYVYDYIKMAYTERMAEYKTYLDNNGSKTYYYQYRNENRKKKYLSANFRDSLFECEYGTPFSDMSTESRLLFVTPGTTSVVRSEYMIFDLDNNTVGEEAVDIIAKMANKTAIGCCRHFALAASTLCRYLGVECWTPIHGGYNHQWTIAKVKTSAGKTTYYLVDNQYVYELVGEDGLRYAAVGDYTGATRAEMGDAYPW